MRWTIFNGLAYVQEYYLFHFLFLRSTITKHTWPQCCRNLYNIPHAPTLSHFVRFHWDIFNYFYLRKAEIMKIPQLAPTRVLQCKFPVNNPITKMPGNVTNLLKPLTFRCSVSDLSYFLVYMIFMILFFRHFSGYDLGQQHTYIPCVDTSPNPPFFPSLSPKGR